MDKITQDKALNMFEDVKTKIKNIVTDKGIQYYTISNIYNGNQKFIELKMSIKVE